MQDVEVAPVQLTGRGHVFNSSGVYTPGDYHSLVNMVISPIGSLKRRPPVHGLKHSSSIQLNKIVGQVGPNVLYSSYDRVNRLPLLYQSSQRFNVKAITLGNIVAFRTAIETASAFPAGTKHLTIEGSFLYNDDIYFILLHSNIGVSGSNITYNKKLYVVRGIDYNNISSIDDIGSFDLDATPANFVDFAIENPVFDNTNFKAIPLDPVAGYTIFKERAWVASGDTVYFSRATELSKFDVVDDGGFFKFPGEQVKSLVALGDNVYVILSNSVRVINYSTSPNVDSRVTIISDGVGGVDASAYGDTVYVINRYAVYTINGNNFSKVMELPKDYVFSSDYKRSNSYTTMTNGAFSRDMKLQAFQDGLYFCDRTLVFDSFDASFWNTRYARAISDGAIVYRLDLNDGHFSSFSFASNISAGVRKVNCTADFRVVSFGYGQQSQDRLYFMGSRLNNSTGYSSFFISDNDGLVYGPDDNESAIVSDLGLDTYSNDAGTELMVCPIEVDVSVVGFSPDQQFFLQKRWRAIQIQGNLPHVPIDFALAASFDHTVVPELLLTIFVYDKADVKKTIVSHYLSEHTVLGDPTDIVTRSSGYTYGIGQKNHNIGFSIQTRTDYIPVSVETINTLGRTVYTEQARCELTHIQFLYTYLRSRSVM